MRQSAHKLSWEKNQTLLKMTSFSVTSLNGLPSLLNEALNEEAKSLGLDILITELLASVRTIGTNLRNGEYSNDTVGTQNTFGDNQLDVDVKTDEGIKIIKL